MAYKYGTVTLLSSMYSLSIIITTINSVIFLKETLLWIDVISIFIVCLGSTLFLLNAKSTNDNFNMNQLEHLFSSPASICIYAFFILYCVIAHVIQSKTKRLLDSCYIYIYELNMLHNQRSACYVKNVDSTASSPNTIPSVTPLDNSRIPNYKFIIEALQTCRFYKIKNTQYNFSKLFSMYKLPLVLMTSIAGMLGGFQVSFLRATTIAMQLNDWSRDPYSFFFLSMGLLLACGMLKFLNIPMEMYD